MQGLVSGALRVSAYAGVVGVRVLRTRATLRSLAVSEKIGRRLAVLSESEFAPSALWACGLSRLAPFASPSANWRFKRTARTRASVIGELALRAAA